MENVFAERLRALRATKNIRQTELSQHLGTTRACVSAWEMGISYPSITSLIKVADYFEVSTDFLLGHDKFSAIGVAGLSSTDVAILENLAQRLRSKN